MTALSFLVGDARVQLPISSDDVNWFGRILSSRGVDLRTRIPAALAATRDAAFVIQVAMLLAAHELVPDTVRVELRLPERFDLGVTAAVWSVIRALRRSESTNPGLFEACWRSIFAAAPIAVSQARSADRDHVWEFLNAAAFDGFGTDVRINPSGLGVDVSGRIDDLRWGIECKVLYSADTRRHVDRIIEGVKQLETDSSVDKGVVAVNVTNCIDHETFRRSLEGKEHIFSSPEDARGALASAVRAVVERTCTHSLQNRLTRDKSGLPRTKCRSLIFLAQTVALAGSRVAVFTAQYSVLRKPAAVSDRQFVNSYNAGWSYPPV